MICETCGHDNEADAKFCRQCGSKTMITKVSSGKGQVEFTSGKQRTRDDNYLCFGEEVEYEGAGYVVGAIFICIGVFIAVVMIFPDFVGNFFGNFGEFFGQIGSDIGNFFGSWGDSFGNAIGNFFSTLFSESNIWDTIIKIIIPAAFIIPGIIVILTSVAKRR
ncbi:MAG: zinc-ribbon domain-containing protein [Candidatus Kariarchaeaceae archaeon]